MRIEGLRAAGVLCGISRSFLVRQWPTAAASLHTTPPPVRRIRCLSAVAARTVILALLVLSSGCAARYTLVKTEQIGPAFVETWKDGKAHACQRRAFFGGYYYESKWGEVPCP